MQKSLLLLSCLVLLSACDRYSEAKDAVEHELIDPTSPLYRDVQNCFFNKEVVKGEVNAKNRMGAYTGFEPFMYYEGRVAIGFGDPNWASLFAVCTKNMPKDSTTEN